MNLWAYAVTGLCVALLTSMAVLVALSLRARRQQAGAVEGLTEQLSAAHAELLRLGDRIDELARPPASAAEPYVITGVVNAADDPGHQPALPVAARFVSVVETARPTWVPAKPVREALIRGVALGHGLRRAVSADNRDRMLLEFRAEVRRSRRQRKAEIRAARKYLRQQRDAGRGAA